MTKEIRVLQLIESGGPGGAEKVVLHLAKGLSEIGIPNAVSTFRAGWLTEALKAEGIEHRLIETKRGLDLLLPAKIARAARNIGAAVLHTHLVDSSFYGAAARLAGGVPMVATEHGDVHHIKQKKFLRSKLKLVSALSSQIVAVSAYTRERLIELGVSPEKTSILHNPVLCPEPGSDARAKLRKSLGLSEDCSEDWLWLNAANLRPVKDHETLIRAFAVSLRGGLPRQTLCILGDGDLREKLESLTVQCGCAERVRFLGFRNDVSEWLAAADGFVLSSLSEAMPISLLEAVLSGLPIVSTNVGGISEVVGTGAGAALVGPADPAALGRALRSMCSGGSVPRKDALERAERFRPLLSPKAVAESYLALYREALGK